MAVAIVNAPRGKRSSLRVSDINLDDDGTTKIGGLITTRNQGDTSMYVPVAASLGYEKGANISYKVTSNSGGYFDALFVNAASSTTATGGEIRAIEAKTTINADMDAGAIGTGVYAKVTVANAAEVATAYGVDVLLEESGTGAITSGVGVRVQGGAGAIDYALDISGNYRTAAVKLPYKTGAAIDSAGLATAFGIAEGGSQTGIIGFMKDTDNSKFYLVAMMEGAYKIIELVDAG